MTEFESQLEAILQREVAGVERLLRCERLSGGASQETYRLTVTMGGAESQLCVRRAPGGERVETLGVNPGLAVEAQLMRLAREAGVPEPEVHYVLQASDGLGEGFIMEWLEGEALGARIVRSPALDEIRPRLAYLCGEALGRIHQIDFEATGLADVLERVSPADYVEQTWERYRLLQTPQPMIDYAAQWLMANLPEGYDDRLVHNDFRNGNIMFSPDGIVAVLDWELAHIGDPMRDLGWICTNSWRFGRTDLPVGGFGAYEDLFAGYESITGEPVDRERVKFWEVLGSFWWSVGCLGMAEHYRHGPDQTVERPAIGRRSSECQVDCVNLLIPGPVDVLAPEANADVDMPRIDELVGSVRDFLHDDVMAATEGRTNFLARVAGNSLDIVLRDLAVGGAHRQQERNRLARLLGADGSQALGPLRQELVRRLRAGECDLDDPELQAHLRQTVVNQVAIDQPKYSGFKTAAAWGS